MKEAIEQIILDFHNAEIPMPSKREFFLPALPRNVRKAIVFIGMRRSGKTWAMYQQMQSLLAKGINKQQILYVNFEDDRLSSMRSNDFQSILDAYFTLYPQYAQNKDIYFFFDEIHEINGWERFIRRLLDQEQVKIYISGSSAKMLSKEIASALRGRTIVQEIFPFSFREYLSFKEVFLPKRLTTKQRATVAHYAKEFLQYGGFPEAVSLDKQFHRDLLQGYIDAVIYRDIVERHHISNSSIVREFIKYCLQNAASLVSMNKIYHRFRSQGLALGKNSLYEFSDYLHDAYCIFPVPLYAHSHNKQAVNPKKIYTVDQGLITAYTIKPEFEEASRLENAVFCHLRRQTEEIFYYKTKTGKEVDFLTLNSNGSIGLYQACVSLTAKETFQREITALTEAMQELGIKQATIVTKGKKQALKFKEGVIHQIPIEEWLLM